MADIESVADILKSRGHCPVRRLSEIQDGDDIGDPLKAAINKWLMEYSHAKPKEVKITGEIEVTRIERTIIDPEK